MIFNDTTSAKAGLVQDIFYLIFGDSGDHTADYPLTDIARNLNHWYEKIVVKILQADSRWEWDDTNKSDLPIANISLVNGQQDYGITAATFLKVRRVDCKDSAGNSTNLKQFSEEDIRGTADAEFQKTAGTPKYYRIQGSSVFLYPKPNYAYTNGLRIFYQRNVDKFISTDTTKTPGIAENFHRLLSMGSAYEYCLVNGLNVKAATLMAEIQRMEADLIDFYSDRNVDKVSLKLGREDYGETALASDGQRNYNPDGFGKTLL